MVFNLEEFLGLSVFHPSKSVSDHVAFFLGYVTETN